MSYHITVCDDSDIIREKVIRTLRSLESEINEKFEIVEYRSAEELLFEYSDRTHILILDIQMMTMTGMQAAKELRRRGKNVQIIFLTALSEYAVEGYDVHAYSFLVKPIDENILKEKVCALIALISADKPIYLELRNKDGIDILDIRSILYIESFSHDVVVHTKEGTATYPKRMRDIEAKLCEHDFFRVHKSFLINLKAVSRIAGEYVIMNDQNSVPISRNRRKEFLIQFTDFIQ